ncbi:hypothetical protein GHT06_013074 [Daphnia sinensis]|uniref:Uncharacterized protein n=1 Tax=Daphnia sinensis TaxID=1820382 RepID=A0AAD5PZL4_9CRUS|nr:hypothetical protein GHT06_013074 [Daphnia sinensis]
MDCAISYGACYLSTITSISSLLDDGYFQTTTKLTFTHDLQQVSRYCFKYRYCYC